MTAAALILAAITALAAIAEQIRLDGAEPQPRPEQPGWGAGADAEAVLAMTAEMRALPPADWDTQVLPVVPAEPERSGRHHEDTVAEVPQSYLLPPADRIMNPRFAEFIARHSGPKGGR